MNTRALTAAALTASALAAAAVLTAVGHHCRTGLAAGFVVLGAITCARTRRAALAGSSSITHGEAVAARPLLCAMQ